jgi:hypothetical protein
MMSLDKTSSSVTHEGYGVIEDYITISNVGEAELEFEITDIDFPAKFTVTPSDGTVQVGSSQTITLTYDFTTAKGEEFSGSFKISSNSCPDPVVKVSLHAYLKVPVLNLDKTSSLVTLDGITTIEDYITVSNIGDADLEFEITDIDFPEKLTVTPLTSTIQPDGSQIITLTYDFDYAKNKEYTGSFKILSNDAKNPEVEIALCATIVVGIEQLQVTSDELRVFPNPTRGELHVTRDALHVTDVEIFDVFGRKCNVSRVTSNENTMDFSYLPAGVYFIKIDGHVFKFIKQ